MINALITIILGVIGSLIATGIIELIKYLEHKNNRHCE